MVFQMILRFFLPSFKISATLNCLVRCAYILNKLMLATHFYTAGMRARVLYWGFTNVDEILHTRKTVSAPGIWLLAQLAATKVVATALCKGSGLVGGLYAPSLMIGANVGAVFGGLAGELINSAILGNVAIAQPQPYALVIMP